jgi:hypothetical protein
MNQPIAEKGVPMPRNHLLAAFALIAATALCACDAVDTVKEGFKHGQAVSDELEKSLGAKSFVGFNWNNGSLTSVEVRFQGLPQNHTLQEIADVSHQAVLREFKQDPRQIVIAFALESGK